jgi:hypothetical protein
MSKKFEYPIAIVRISQYGILVKTKLGEKKQNERYLVKINNFGYKTFNCKKSEFWKRLKEELLLT